MCTASGRKLSSDATLRRASCCWKAGMSSSLPPATSQPTAAGGEHPLRFPALQPRWIQGGHRAAAGDRPVPPRVTAVTAGSCAGTSSGGSLGSLGSLPCVMPPIDLPGPPCHRRETAPGCRWPATADRSWCWWTPTCPPAATCEPGERGWGPHSRLPPRRMHHPLRPTHSTASTLRDGRNSKGCRTSTTPLSLICAGRMLRR